MKIESLDELRVFAQVVEAGSLTAASRVLGVTPNYVSRRLARLESRVGSTLVARTTRRLHITDEGTRLYERARRILEEVTEAETELAPSADELRGSLRISVPTLTLPLGLLSRAGPLLAAHPQLSLELLVSDAPCDPVALGCDLAVHVGTPPDSTHVARRIGTLIPRLGASTGYLHARGRPQAPSDLAEHECLRFIGDRPQTHWVLVDSVGSEHVVPIGGRFASTDSRGLLDAMRAGLGIGLVGHGARPIDDAGVAVETVLPGYRLPKFELFAVVPAGRQRLPKIRAALQLLRDLAADAATAWA